MFPSSDFTVTLNPSKDFYKLFFLIHLGALISLWQSMLPFIYCVFLMLVLIFLCCAKLGTAMPNIHKISYRGKQWLLENYSGEPYQFEQVSLRVDGQFFMLLVFSTPAANMRKTVLVFNDQLQKTEAKTLKIISKIKR